jgi:hypothetical protein
MWPNFIEIGRILPQAWPEGLAVIWQQCSLLVTHIDIGLTSPAFLRVGIHIQY